jgi:hypothetical protein
VDADQFVDDFRLDLYEGPISAEARVVDDERELRIAGYPRLDRGESICIGEVGGERLGFDSSLAVQPLGQRLQPVPSPRYQDEVMTIAR